MILHKLEHYPDKSEHTKVINANDDVDFIHQQHLQLNVVNVLVIPKYTTKNPIFRHLAFPQFKCISLAIKCTS